MSVSRLIGVLILGYILLLGKIYSSPMIAMAIIGFILAAVMVVKVVFFVRWKVENA